MDYQHAFDIEPSITDLLNEWDGIEEPISFKTNPNDFDDYLAFLEEEKRGSVTELEDGTLECHYDEETELRVAIGDTSTYRMISLEISPARVKVASAA